MKNGELQELIYIMGSKKEILKRNLLAGIARGVGIGIGVTLITAFLVTLLRNVIAWNIPIIGEFVADIVDIVERNQSY